MAASPKVKADTGRMEEQRKGAASERFRTAQKAKMCTSRIYTTF